MPMTEGGKHPGGRPKLETGPAAELRAEQAERDLMREQARKRILSQVRLALTPELLDEILGKVAIGNYPGVAAEALGVPATTFGRWLADGENVWLENQHTGDFTTRVDPLGLRVELFLLVRQTEARWEDSVVEGMMGAMQEGRYIKNHLLVLERRVPSHWGKREVPLDGLKALEDMASEWDKARQEQLRDARAATAGIVTEVD